MNSTLLPESVYTSTRFAEKTTERFQPVTTFDALNNLQRDGWEVFRAEQARTRFPDRVPFVRHVVQLRHPDYSTRDGLQPLVYLQNANDGTSSFRLFAGLFRFICSNGLVIGSSFMSLSVRHTGTEEKVTERLGTGIHKVASQFPTIMEKVERMREKVVTPEESLALSSLAYRLRFPNHTLERAHYNAWNMGRVRREGDKGDDLWTTYNRIQEDVVRGGFSTGRRRVGLLRSIARNTRVNRELWGLAELALDGKIVEKEKEIFSLN